MSVPPRNVRRDFVAERVGQKRWMADAASYPVAQHALRVKVPPLVDDEAEILFGRQPNHHPESVSMRGIEQ